MKNYIKGFSQFVNESELEGSDRRGFTPEEMLELGLISKYDYLTTISMDMSTEEKRKLIGDNLKIYAKEFRDFSLEEIEDYETVDETEVSYSDGTVINFAGASGWLSFPGGKRVPVTMDENTYFNIWEVPSEDGDASGIFSYVGCWAFAKYGVTRILFEDAEIIVNYNF